jgi:hypothetical protein
MIKKIFSNSNIFNSDFFVKKSLSAKVYPKYYVRKCISGECKNLSVLDNNSEFFKVKTGKTHNLGSSCNYDLSQYTSNRNKALKFKYITFLSKKSSISKLKLIYSFLFQLKRKKASGSVLGTFLFSKVDKQSITGHSLGVSGFLPMQVKKQNKKQILRSLEYPVNIGTFTKFKALKNSSSLSSKMVLYRSKFNFILDNSFFQLKRKKASKKFIKKPFFNYIFITPNKQIKKKVSTYGYKKTNKKKFSSTKPKAQ